MIFGRRANTTLWEIMKKSRRELHFPPANIIALTVVEDILNKQKVIF